MKTQNEHLSEDYQSLNSSVSIMDKNGNYPLDNERLAVRSYFLNHVNKKMRFWHDTEERLNYLLSNEYYDPAIFNLYSDEFLIEISNYAYSFKFRFKTLLGAMKFFKQYALKDREDNTILERYEDRVVCCALHLAQGNESLAKKYVRMIIEGKYQPATPTFSNTGKFGFGQLVSCFILSVSDNLESISKKWANAAQLSKIGGGVGSCITDIRAFGDPIKNFHNRASGLIGWCKIEEMVFNTVDQLGSRPGAGIVWVNALHLDAPDLIDSKKINIDENVRLKTLNIGLVIPDVLYQKAKDNESVYLFSPYDVQRQLGKPMSQISLTEHYDFLSKNKNVRKKAIDARGYFQHISRIQTESGYPFIMNEDIVNKANNIKGYISGSNLCSEILQVSQPSTFSKETGDYEYVGKDISCNLGSLNIYNTVVSGNEFPEIVECAVRMCSTVSDLTNISIVPSIARGNRAHHSIGIGAMNLHGALVEFGMEYGDRDSIIFTDVWFMTLRYWALKVSNKLAKEHGKIFENFEESKYANGTALTYYFDNDYHDGRISSKVKEIFDRYGFYIPTVEDWKNLNEEIMKTGLYNAYLLAVAPTGSTSYVNNSTSSIHPITSQIEERYEGKIYCYYPAPHLTNENRHLYQDAYQIGYEKLIDIYAAATPHVDQGLSMSLFFQREETTTRTLDKARLYAWKKGIKTLYYTRMRAETLADDLLPTKSVECESCSV
ncbi:MAG: class 1b ribonucleoside-diphosphate reductase subunit alpha [Methanobrevibacter sp.]|nr:class 1b ribonucleoside-diphosphate reductase subunit alpha [Methanobrevibacter sp.]